MKAARRSLMTLVCLAPVASGSLLQADEVRLEGHDLQVRVDWRWVGGDGGGYYPLRIEAVNKGAARNVEFAFVCRDAGYPGARRTLELDAGATTRFTLLVPLCGIARPGISRFPSRGGARRAVALDHPAGCRSRRRPARHSRHLPIRAESRAARSRFAPDSAVLDDVGGYRHASCGRPVGAGGPVLEYAAVQSSDHRPGGTARKLAGVFHRGSRRRDAQRSGGTAARAATGAARLDGRRGHADRDRNRSIAGRRSFAREALRPAGGGGLESCRTTPSAAGRGGYLAPFPGSVRNLREWTGADRRRAGQPLRPRRRRFGRLAVAVAVTADVRPVLGSAVRRFGALSIPVSSSS